MSRSPYDPRPNYVTCSYCGYEIDEDYEGPHLCKQKLAETISKGVACFGVSHVIEVAKSCHDTLAKEEYVKKRSALARELDQKRAQLEDVRTAIAILESELKALR